MVNNKIKGNHLCREHIFLTGDDVRVCLRDARERLQIYYEREICHKNLAAIPFVAEQRQRRRQQQQLQQQQRLAHLPAFVVQHE